jgi:hypothetical protein
LSPEALTARRQGLLTELSRVAASREELRDGLRLSFAAGEEVLATIFKTIVAERRCCEFLTFEVRVEPAGGRVTLDLTGPQGTREFLAALLDS